MNQNAGAKYFITLFPATCETAAGEIDGLVLPWLT